MQTEARSGMSVISNDLLKSGIGAVRSWLTQYAEQLSTKIATKLDEPCKFQIPNDFNLVSNFESILVDLQSLLIWENPFNSALALTTFTCLYWLIVLWSPRFFSIIAILFFCYHFYEMWTRYLWPEIRVPSKEIKVSWTSVNPNVLSAPEIQSCWAKFKRLLAIFMSEIANLRHRSHGTFCFLSISFLSLFYFIGKNIPGVILVYSLVMVLVLTPGFLLHVFPNHMFDTMIEYCNTLVSNNHPSSNEMTKNFEKENEKVEENNSFELERSVKDDNDSRSFSPLLSHFSANVFSKSNVAESPSLITETSDSGSEGSDDFEIISETECIDNDSKSK